MATISEALAAASEHQRAGRLAAAEEIYAQIVAALPECVTAWHQLGVIACETGRSALARECLGRAIELDPHRAEPHHDLGEAWLAEQNLVEAAHCYEQALRLNSDLAESINGLGAVLLAQARDGEALPYFQRAVELKPNLFAARYNLANALRACGRTAEAIEQLWQTVALQPQHAGAWNNLGGMLVQVNRFSEAVECLRRAIESKPGYALAHNNLGVALRELGEVDAARAAFEDAIRCQPDYAEACYNLANLFSNYGDYDRAVELYQRAIQLQPNLAAAWHNLGVALKDQGRLEEALAALRRGTELRPNDPGLHGTALYTLNFCPGYDAAAIGREHRRWNELHARSLAPLSPSFVNDRDVDRRLRVGYVSPDFFAHPVGRFILPLLEAHDHRALEIVAYASVRKPDFITDRCRAAVDVWHDVGHLSDEQLAGAIRGDRIDVLVDLTMHMAHNRLLTFARKPAPVQVTYLAYCGTTGLTTIDYRLTDPYLDPPGGDESIYSEQSVRLPESYWCYQPAGDPPPVSPLPAPAAGCVTFGCLNNFAKVTDQTLDAWGRLLQQVPRSRLLIHARLGSHRQRALALFAQRGVAAERVDFVNFVMPPDYFDLYGQIDIALDPFPYGGGTTTCDALWMGVPVVSLAGETAVGRAGLSLLSNVGLRELVAADVGSYIRIAARLSAELPRLAEIRATLRDRMRASPLMDVPRFARNVEAAYREMWRRWAQSDERG